MKNPYPELIGNVLTGQPLRKNLKHTIWQEGYDNCQEEAQELYSNLRKEYKDLYEALKRVEQDINWMLNNEKFLNPSVFDYIDEAIAKAGGDL